MSTALHDLKVRRRELVAEEAKLVQAEAAMDADAVVAARQRADVLRQFITRLEHDATGALAAQAKARAERWLWERETSRQKAAADVTAAQAIVAQRLKGVLEAIDAERQLRATAESDTLAADILAARFELASGGPAQMPPLTDWGGAVADATDKMRTPSRRHLIVPRSHSMTPAQVRTATLRVVNDFVEKRSRVLPSAVVAILRDAPIPPEVLVIPSKEPSAEEQRSMAKAGADARDLEASLNAFGGKSSSGLGLR